MKFYSTNHVSKHVSLEEALMQGQAPDKGLYMPEKIPKLTDKQIQSFEDKEYWQIAHSILRKFVSEKSIPKEKLAEMCKSAYNFSVPIEKTGDLYIMRLDQGPTASFKDFAARMMARMLDYYCERRNKKLTILTATSGDTGSAVANAFNESENIEMIVLFPEKEVSERQRKLMTTLRNKAIAINGKFDDCQALVKKAFSDPDLKYMNLSSANSINIGRLLPQSVYYFYAQSRIKDKVIFSVPSGNFGDLMGGLIAREMNLPIERFIVAVNENDEVPKFFENEEYSPIKPSKNCLSNAMNVGHPSNLARVFDLYNGHMDEKGIIHKMPDIAKMRADFYAKSITDKITIKTIHQAYKNSKLILEPHGSVAYAAAKEYSKNYAREGSIVCLETAHPAKFPEVVMQETGIDPELPESMKKLECKQENYLFMDNSYGKFKSFLLSQNY
jgi:threonine synthase